MLTHEWRCVVAFGHMATLYTYMRNSSDIGGRCMALALLALSATTTDAIVLSFSHATMGAGRWDEVALAFGWPIPLILCF